MTYYTIDRLREFVYRLDYFVETERFYQVESGQIRTEGGMVSYLLNSPASLLFREFRNLDVAITQLDPLHPDLKKIWTAFYQAVGLNQESLILSNFKNMQEEFPRNNQLAEFQDTDLIQFEDDTLKPLPFNGIRNSEIPKLLKEYQTFISKLKFSDPVSQSFKEQVYRNIRTLMSRPLGRELIQRLLAKPWKQLEIEKASRSSWKYKMRDKKHIIGLSNERKSAYHEIPQGGLDSFLTPSFMSLAHELIHMLHCEEGKFEHKTAILVPEHYTNWTEHATIDGYCPCHGHSRISEKSLRRQFRILPRKTHKIALDRSDCIVKQFQRGVEMGAAAQLVRCSPFVPEKIFEEGIERLSQKRSFASIAALEEAALKNPSLRLGPFKDILAQRSSLSPNSDNFEQFPPSFLDAFPLESGSD